MLHCFWPTAAAIRRYLKCTVVPAPIGFVSFLGKGSVRCEQIRVLVYSRIVCERKRGSDGCCRELPKQAAGARFCICYSRPPTVPCKAKQADTTEMVGRFQLFFNLAVGVYLCEPVNGLLAGGARVEGDNIDLPPSRPAEEKVQH